MHKEIYVNLPVADLPRAKAFFGALGYGFEPGYTNDDAACLVLGDNLFAMLLTEPFYAGFTAKKIADARATSEVMVCLSCDSRAEVDALVARARAAGATVPREPQQYGFMYGHGFDDLDGHSWDLVWMDPDAAPPAA